VAEACTPLERLRGLVASGELELAPPGRGTTPERHRILYGLGREDVALARLAEAHLDAVSILAEAGRAPAKGAIYGVWASEGGGVRLKLEESEEGLRLAGAKRFCTGAGLVDRALVVAETPTGPRLVDAGLTASGVDADSSDWATSAFAATATGTMRFDDVHVPATALVGEPHWYADRAGFWMGAVGPAACWAGGASGLVDAAWEGRRGVPHGDAHLGALRALAWANLALLDAAGREMDEAPDGPTTVHQARALQVRHLVERACTEIIDRFGRATGPRLLAFDGDIARRHAELSLYLLQCHGERDLETLAQAVSGD